MSEQWEMCQIETVNKKIYKSLYTPRGVERIQLLSQEHRDKVITELLVQGWEPFAASELPPTSWGKDTEHDFQGAFSHYFRRRIRRGFFSKDNQ